MAHTVYLEFKCIEGKGKEFLEVLLPALTDTRAFSGCINVETYSNSDAPDTVFLWEKWESRSDQEAYMTCLLYTSDAGRRSTLCRSRWSPYH